MNINEMPGSFEDKENPTKVMEYMDQMGKDISDNARAVIGMIEYAKQNNIPIDLSNNETIKKFAPLGEYEIAFINLRSALGSLKTDLLNQGVKMTYEDLHNQHEPVVVKSDDLEKKETTN